jgi:hypothetical protein
VSRLHGQVSRELFAPLFPHWPVEEVPIGHVTNGVHMPTWECSVKTSTWISSRRRRCVNWPQRPRTCVIRSRSFVTHRGSYSGPQDTRAMNANPGGSPATNHKFFT